MTTHTAHGRIATTGLADDCDRCTEHASHPFYSLDDNNLRRLVQMARSDELPLTRNDRIALAQVRDVMAKAQRLARVSQQEGLQE